jgi:DHA1 family inner membrane transport protein
MGTRQVTMTPGGANLAARTLGAFAQSLPTSAANVGIAFGSFAGGVAIGNFTASAAVIAGLIIAVIATPVAWATSFLKPPLVGDATEPAAVPDLAASSA